MGTLEVCALAPLLRFGGFDPPLVVVGVTHPQTCLVLRGRLRALRRAGLRVVLISAPGTLATEIAAEEGVEHLGIPMKRGISPLADLVSVCRLYGALRRLRPVLAEFSTPKAGLLGSIASFLCRIPVRIYLLRGLRLETASGLQRRILEISERIAAACCHLVMCNSESLRSHALALGIAPQRKLRIVGNGSSGGVDMRPFRAGNSNPTAVEARAGLGIAGNVPVIGFVGRLTRDKGIPELLRAFEQVLKNFPQAMLLLVGWFDDSEDALTPAQRAWIETHPRIVLHRVCLRDGPVLSRHGLAGPAHLARGIPQRGSGSGGQRCSGGNHAGDRRARCGAARPHRAAGPAGGLPGSGCGHRAASA